MVKYNFLNEDAKRILPMASLMGQQENDEESYV